MHMVVWRLNIARFLHLYLYLLWGKLWRKNVSFSAIGIVDHLVKNAPWIFEKWSSNSYWGKHARGVLFSCVLAPCISTILKPNTRGYEMMKKYLSCFTCRRVMPIRIVRSNLNVAVKWLLISIMFLSAFLVLRCTFHTTAIQNIMQQILYFIIVDKNSGLESFASLCQNKRAISNSM